MKPLPIYCAYKHRLWVDPCNRPGKWVVPKGYDVQMIVCGIHRRGYVWAYPIGKPVLVKALVERVG